MAVRLISVEKIKERMKLPNNPELDVVLESTVGGTELYLSSKLETSLSKGSAVNYFYTDEESPQKDGTHALRLTYAFPHNVVVSESASLEGEFTPVPTLAVKDFQGVVVVVRSTSPRYLKVEYDYGFEDEDERVPDWLAEAALTYSVQLMLMQQLSDAKPSANPMLDLVKNHTESILNAKLRTYPLVIRPTI